MRGNHQRVRTDGTNGTEGDGASGHEITSESIFCDAIAEFLEVWLHTIL